MSIAENIARIHDRIGKTCLLCGRDPAEVKVVAVTKHVDIDRIVEAIESGIEIIGENRVQEAWDKYQQLRQKVSWHMIGHLQTNKARRALQFADVIQSVDSLHLAEELEKQATGLDKSIDVFVQVNTSEEPNKFGFAVSEAVEAVTGIAELRRLKVKGLMTIGVFSDNADRVRVCFRRLREIRDRVVESSFKNVGSLQLSMGMTNDFELAIEEGATMVRIGTEIFGERERVRAK
jgi:pyridoxal phosphate enzyme (YggS family)